MLVPAIVITYDYFKILFAIAKKNITISFRTVDPHIEI